MVKREMEKPLYTLNGYDARIRGGGEDPYKLSMGEVQG